MYGEPLNEEKIRTAMGLSQNEHFYEALYTVAVGAMENEDGTKGPHYSIDEVKELIEKHDIQLNEYNIFDFAYSLNMVYSDFKGNIPDNDKSYVDVAKAFLFDKDGPKGKAVKYYMAMKYGVEPY